MTTSKFAKWAAAVCGVLGVLMAVLSPLLPVDRTTSELNWPQARGINDVAAPLVSFVPLTVDVSVPCALAKDLPSDGGVLLSTIPADGKQASARGLFIRATGDALVVIDRDVVILTTKRAAAQSNPNCRIVFTGNGDGVHARFDGIDAQQPAAGEALRFDLPDPDMRPQIVGVYTDLPSSANATALSLHADIDTRFATTPSTLKFWAIVFGILMTVLSLVALGIIDARDGRGHKRILPVGWWRPRPLDAVVFAILAFWWIAGTNTSDDGYNFTVGRITGNAGYADNYFRYFGVPQDPFGWHFQVISAMSEVSLAAPWMRLPAFALGLLGWWLISREVVPRLGRTVRNSTPAMWSAAFVFLAIWLPYNNGLRPEPAEAVGALLTWCCVERAIATRRLLPYALAALTAAFTLALAPGGLMAAAALLAGVRPIIKTIVSRRKRDGLLPMLAPIAAAGFAVLYQIGADQSVMPLVDAYKVAADVGPTLEWWEEPVRYYYLILPTADGTVARRFGILAMILCLFVVMFRLMRREHPNAIARAPIWRLIAVTLGTMFFISFTPTKWTHHFGVYAGIAGGLAAAAGAMMSPIILRSRRNRTFFASAMLTITGLAFAGPNGWWFVGSYGIPWWDRPPAVAGLQFSWIFLALAVITAFVGLWYHFRDDYTDEQTRSVGSSRLSRLKIAPLPVLSAFVVIFMVVSFAKAAYVQRDSWSWLNSNARALQGNECALANDVMVDADPNVSMLRPARVDATTPSIAAALAGKNSTGFTPEGVPTKLSIDATESDDSSDSSSASSTSGGGTEPADANDDSSDSASGDAAGGRGEKGVNGSTVRLPFGLTPATTPVLGSNGSPSGTGSFTSDWYQMPFSTSKLDPDAPLLTVAAAGSVDAVDGIGVRHPGQQVTVQFGRRGANGTITPLRQMTPIDIAKTEIWRDLRFPLADAPKGADVVRIIAKDTSGAPTQWVAVTPPRIAKLRTLNDVVGQTDPVFIDWLPGMVFPCQQPMVVRNGVLEVPKWRILPDAEATEKNSQTWMAGKSGGPLGITEAMLIPTIVPSYLRNNWGRDWGSLQSFTEIAPAPPAKLTLGTTRESGLWDLGPMRSTGY
ncbi:putative arabinosyltransferase [Gordonia effusa NBRC 100432]|uniref:Putative arabinosyltransferase n=1 Tax=Gordonia effusa NBRC 100432 TaxID=1077974 RepID=H0R131_9ACTN|nr:arabinosyltransferase domain-containing protein [Gordonia effusa]GAB18782.1 putative arabinosyltransferase [Gordonia effusa NBRC 100432]